MPISSNRPGEAREPSRASAERITTDPAYQPRFADPTQVVEQAPQQAPVRPNLAEPTLAPAAPETTPQQAPVQPQAVPEYHQSNQSADDEYDEVEEADAERLRALAELSDDAKENATRLLERIADDESSEVLLNGPEEIIFKVNGQRRLDNIRFDDVETYHTVINYLILAETDTADRIGKTEHLIEGQLTLPDYENPAAPPTVARVHVIAPPVVKAAKVTIAKKAKRQFRLEDLQAKNSMSPTMVEFLKALSRGRATIVFSGLSGSGKTTLLEAMSHQFDQNDRVLIAEDTAELHLPVADSIPLLSTSKRPGQNPEDIVTLEWLVAQANRMRPDRIIVGEVRGGEMAEFLSAANSGADGSMTTVHASSARQAIAKMVSLSMKSATAKSENSVLRDIASTVHVIVQTSLVDGRHVISEITEVTDVALTDSGTVQLQEIYKYDRMTARWTVAGRPSDKLASYLAQRGVALDNKWFARV